MAFHQSGICGEDFKKAKNQKRILRKLILLILQN